jgi:hypothetical protein
MAWVTQNVRGEHKGVKRAVDKDVAGVSILKGIENVKAPPYSQTNAKHTAKRSEREIGSVGDGVAHHVRAGTKAPR